jgi:hypothetical protein
MTTENDLREQNQILTEKLNRTLTERDAFKLDNTLLNIQLAGARLAAKALDAALERSP